MSAEASVFSGPIILNAILKGKPGKGDEIAKLLSAIRANANSNAEPGCSTFRTARHGDNFVVFEKYDDQKAVQFHFESKYFKALVAADVLDGPPSLLYYEEFS
ncbi:hypothetical protein SCHPADRAFT_897855 [Schizopora paradoxa]|uniref:ABM domain-containing protein n=1 Tax=Schizopora paradoxa TaxID=27342 RepID=A0A0H2S8H6_9AGAM|nr:hypothetical protein SCHPADRAFT_897855 [Schizopora paradoxa]